MQAPSHSTPAPPPSSTTARRTGTRSASSSRPSLRNTRLPATETSGRPRTPCACCGSTGCDGVVVGRGCLGRPWLFRDLAAVFAGEAAPPENPPRLRRRHRHDARTRAPVMRLGRRDESASATSASTRRGTRRASPGATKMREQTHPHRIPRRARLRSSTKATATSYFPAPRHAHEARQEGRAARRFELPEGLSRSTSRMRRRPPPKSPATAAECVASGAEFVAAAPHSWPRRLPLRPPSTTKFLSRSLASRSSIDPPCSAPRRIASGNSRREDTPSITTSMIFHSCPGDPAGDS